MTIKLQRISVQDPVKLQELVVAYSETLPGKVKIMDVGLPTEAGPLNLAMDDGGRLVVLLFSTSMDDSQLLRAMAQTAWVANHAALLNRVYGKRGADTTRVPRSIIIGPRFSAALQETAARMVSGVELYEYRALVVNGEHAVLFDSILQSYSDASVFAEEGQSTSTGSQEVGVDLTREEASFFEESRSDSA